MRRRVIFRIGRRIQFVLVSMEIHLLRLNMQSIFAPQLTFIDY